MTYSELLNNNFRFNSSYEYRPGFECVWSSPTSILNIASNEVHIWRIQLDTPFKVITSFDEILSDEEIYKSKKFRLESDRRRYKTSHGSLRKILSQYLHIEPENIQYTFGSFGKPHLDSDINRKQLHFNLSHSGKYALCATTLNRLIGIDLEYMHPAPDLEAMARHFFSFNENKILFSYPPDWKLQIFYSLWTLKEAYLKATGKGIRNLDNVEISLSSDGLHSVSDKENKNTSVVWTILQLKPVNNHAAGLAVEGKDKYTYKFYDYFNE